MKMRIKARKWSKELGEHTVLSGSGETMSLPDLAAHTSLSRDLLIATSKYMFGRHPLASISGIKLFASRKHPDLPLTSWPRVKLNTPVDRPKHRRHFIAGVNWFKGPEFRALATELMLKGIIKNEGKNEPCRPGHLEGSKRWLTLVNRHTKRKHTRLMVLGRCCEWEPVQAFPCKDMVCVGLGWLMKHYPKQLTKELLCLA